MISVQRNGVLSDSTTIDALTMLQRVTDREVGDPLLDWLCKREPVGDVLAVALRTLTSCGGENLIDRIFAKPEYLRYFSRPTLRTSSQSTLRMLIGNLNAADGPAENGFTAAEQFLRELLRSQPVINAQRLLEHRAEVGVPRPLGGLWDVSFTPPDDPLTRFMLQRLVDTDGMQGILTNTMRAIPDFQRRMRPAIEPMLERLASTESADAIARFRESMEAATTVAPSTLPPEQTLGNLWKMASPGVPPGYVLGGAPTVPQLPQRPSIRLRTKRAAWTAVAFVSGMTLIAVGAFVYDGDLPANATLGERLLSRGLSFLAALVFWFGVGFVYVRSNQQLKSQLPGYRSGTLDMSASQSAMSVIWQNVPLFAILGAYAIFEAHRQYVGPIHFWNQSAVFGLNSLGIVYMARAFEVD